MNTQRLKATILIITFLSVGLGLLPSPLIRDANAMTCDAAMELCEDYDRMAEILCDFYGEDTAICDEAWYLSEYVCFYALWTCED